MSTTVKRLPEPLSAADLKLLVRSNQVPSGKPDFHACAYSDGAPWDHCPACEYERCGAAALQASNERSNNIQIIAATFHNAGAGAVAAAWPSRSNDLIASIAAELQKPRKERTYTDEQLADEKLPAEAGSLLAGLRALLPYAA